MKWFAALLVALPACAQEAAHFHHVHLNSTNPEAAIDFYNTRLTGFKGKLLFQKVDRPPASDVVASLYHLGWGFEDVNAAYQHQLDIGTRFETPLGDLADLLGSGTPGRGYYAYIDGPDHALIEMNGAKQTEFQHVHMLADDPVATADWWAKELAIPRRGPVPSKEARFNAKGQQTGPLVFLPIDGILFAWFPTGLAKSLYPKAWEGRTALAPSKGRVIDHVAFTVENLPETLARLRKDGVRVISDRGGTAFIEAPDGVEIELVQTPR